MNNTLFFRTKTNNSPKNKYKKYVSSCHKILPLFYTKPNSLQIKAIKSGNIIAEANAPETINVKKTFKLCIAFSILLSKSFSKVIKSAFVATPSKEASRSATCALAWSGFIPESTSLSNSYKVSICDITSLRKLTKKLISLLNLSIPTRNTKVNTYFSNIQRGYAHGR